MQAREGDFWTEQQSQGDFSLAHLHRCFPWLSQQQWMHLGQEVTFKLCYWAYEIWPHYFLPLFPLTATALNSSLFLRNYPLSRFIAVAETGSCVYYVPSISTPSHLQFVRVLQSSHCVTSSRRPALTTPTPKTRSADPPVCFHSTLDFIRAPHACCTHLLLTCHRFYPLNMWRARTCVVTTTKWENCSDRSMSPHSHRSAGPWNHNSFSLPPNPTRSPL